MKRKTGILAAALLFLAGLAAAAFVFRPVTIQDGSRVVRAQPPVWTVAQALYSSGLRIAPEDRVHPGLEARVPLDGKIVVERAVQAYVWDENQARSIAGLERTARALLAKAGIALAEDDRLLWNGAPLDPDAPLPAGVPLLLQIRRAQAYQVDQEGARSEVRAHAASVAGVLWAVGVRPGPGDWISAAPGSRPAPETVIGYRPARLLAVQHAGGETRARSAAETVGPALAAAGVALQGLDYSLPAEDQPLPADGSIRVVRVREEVHLSETLVPYSSQYAPDPELELDQRRPIQPGQYGVQVTRERARFEDGQEVARAPDSDWTAASPLDETIGYGTKVVTRSEDVGGATIEYWRKIRVYATSYSPCRLGLGDGRCGYTTASGSRLTKGTVAVSLSWFRMMRGQQVYIPGYGFGVIADYGALRGMWIDLGFDEENFEEGAIVGWVDLYFLTPVPATIPWTLP